MITTASQPSYDRNGNVSSETTAVRRQQSTNNARSLDDIEPLFQQPDYFPDFVRSEELIEPDPLLEAVTPQSLLSSASDYYYSLAYPTSSPRPIPCNNNDHLLQVTADGPAILCDSPTPKELPIYSPPDVPTATGIAVSTAMDSDTGSNFTPRASHDYDYYDNTPPSTPPTSSHVPNFTSSQSYTAVPKVTRQVSNPTSSRDQDAPSSRPRSVPPPPRPTSQGTASTSAMQREGTSSDRERERDRDRGEHPRSSTDDQVRVKPRKVLGNYTLTKTLGAGSMGKVKLAVHSITGEKVR